MYDLRIPGLGRWIYLMVIAFGTFAHRRMDLQQALAELRRGDVNHV